MITMNMLVPVTVEMTVALRKMLASEKMTDLTGSTNRIMN
jgi:hypothetical protein